MGEILKNCPVSRQRLLIAAYPEAFGDEWQDKMIALIGRAGPKSIVELARFLADRGETDVLVASVNKGVADRNLSSDLLAWARDCPRGSGRELLRFATKLTPSPIRVNA